LTLAPGSTTSGNGPGPGPSVRRLYFYGASPALLGIQIVNVLLTFLTLGVFHFWGKVRVLRYVLSQTELDGDRFAYYGTGRELLFGFLKAVLLFALPVALLNVQRLDPTFGLWLEAAIVGYVLIYIVLFPLAMVGARRYRFSRTSWRGVRFSFRGRGLDLIRLFARDTLLTLVTLGVYYPWFAVRRHAFLVSHSYFGTEPFRFDGRTRDLLGTYVRLVLLWLPTFGFYWFWFAARKQRYLWRHTTLGSLRFDSAVTGWRLLQLRLGNALILLATLGLAWPWARVRSLRFTCRNLRLTGAFDLSGVRQEPRGATAVGEGLAGLVDAGFEMSW
jgi:uncharacterized membrane protein YjgN (DUF898 family)